MKTLIIFCLLCLPAFADESFFPKVYKKFYNGADRIFIFACISAKEDDEYIDKLNLNLSDPNIEFIKCKREEKETETYDNR